MNIAVDTNVLVRAVVRDDARQAAAADKVLKGASLIVVALPTLCELVWVLRRVYGFSVGDTAAALQALLQVKTAVLNRPAVEAGLRVLTGGGDFADGVIAYESRWLGGETFVTFDKQAVALLKAQGYDAKLLS